jgi:hypothetical protein
MKRYGKIAERRGNEKSRTAFAKAEEKGRLFDLLHGTGHALCNAQSRPASDAHGFKMLIYNRLILVNRNI